MGVMSSQVRRGEALLSAATLVVGTMVAAVAAVGAAPSAASADPPSCQLGNGVHHVISLVFDNVHFFRDNPNVPSDLEQMPHLLNFLESNGTVFSNSHTPLIAHTADDSLTVYTGLYGDRHGQPVTNTYNVYNPDGTTDTATSFTYWTSPIIDTKLSAPSTVDSAPSMTYSDTVPASGTPNRVTPAPWVPFTRAGCTVGNFSTANMVLENAAVDVPTVFGQGSPEAVETAANPDRFKDKQVAEYVGEAVHCAHGDAICADSSRAVPDSLPTEPGGYDDYQALFGAKYIAPAVGGGSNVFHNDHRVTDDQGNLVDLDGNTLVEPFSQTPGFPGFNPTASQSLAVLADMQEAGIPVTYGYISDTHDKKFGATGCTSPGNALGPGDACAVAALHDYDQAFQSFFDRLAEDGITPDNTEFVIGAEENDQFAGANAVGRATQPTPADCDGVTVACHYTNTQDGELQANIRGLLSTTASAGTQYDLQPQGASIYVHGRPAADDPTVRQLERDTAGMTSNLTYSGVPDEHIVKYQAGALEQRVLHMQTNDPLRTPTYSIFPMPDYFFSTSGANVSFNNGFAYNHGYYSPNIDITWAGIVGPGVAVNGVDGPGPTGGNESQDPNSTHTVPEASTQGTWIEEADLRPTLLHLVGLTDDYQTDGQVISQALAHPGSTLGQVSQLGALYRQLNSSVGEFATDTLIADSHALASGSASDDTTYTTEQQALQSMADHRDQVAALMKATLARAAQGVAPGRGELRSELSQGRALLSQAAQLAAHT
jgi:hypothetical protein